MLAVVTLQLFSCARRFVYRMHKMWRVQVLKQLPFLQNASPEIFKRLLQRGQLVKYQRGEVMWQPPSGMSPLSFHLLPVPAFPFLACACSIVSVLLLVTTSIQGSLQWMTAPEQASVPPVSIWLPCSGQYV